ncbi:M23 family metallopeptidase [Roseovarius aestuarii]|nr:M23 family metallopeptidase [Roseovarius aestuarii]
MKLRYVVIAGAGTALAVVLGFQASWETTPPPASLATASVWQPSLLQKPATSFQPLATFANADNDTAPKRPELPTRPVFNAALLETKPPTQVWSGTLSAGETLDALISTAGLSASDRAEVALALGAEYDLRKLKPGYDVEVELSLSGSLKRVMLSVEAGVQIEAVFADEIATRKIIPAPDLVLNSADTTVKSSIFATLASAGVPARFAVDLSEMLGGTVDFRRDLKGGERLQLMWREATLDGQRLGQPRLSFAALTIEDTLYEIVWPVDDSGNATIFVDGGLLRVFAQPVQGARLSSVYGNRRHPVFGDVRMHTGVDFAAPRGTPVYATAPGRISYIGRRSGYGRVVEIAHGSDTQTRYAHLSAVPKGLAIGDRVAAGDKIGRVGATGTATGPNLHYEVRVNGHPTDPMSNDRLAKAASKADTNTGVLKRLQASRAKFSVLQDQNVTASTQERL